MPELRILIADDHAPLRRNIRSLLESHAQWRVCGEAADGEEAVEEAGRLKPDVVLPTSVTVSELIARSPPC